jgi:hypothetical protein
VPESSREEPTVFVSLILSAFLLLAIILSWRWRALACSLAWTSAVAATGFIFYFHLDKALLLLPVLLAILTILGLVVDLKPRLFTAASLVLAAGAGLAIGFSPKRPLPEPHEPIGDVVLEGEALGWPVKRSFYPDDRLFVCRFGTGLDPTYEVEYLPRHVQTLPEIHKRYVDNFILQPGFGMGRHHWSPSEWIELVPEEATPPGTASVLDREYSQRAFLSSQGAVSRPRYDDRNLTLTVPEEQALKVRERVWLARDMQLVGLLMHDTPVVYVNKDVGNHSDRKAKRPPTQTRSLDAFESDALTRLRDGSEVVARTNASKMRLLGAIRARQECLKCHDVQQGDLLGAFSYSLALRPAGSRTE